MSYKVELYKDENGKEPVAKFLKSLPAKHKAKALKIIELLAEFGRDIKQPYALHFEDELWELRIKQATDISRIFYFAEVDNSFVLLHGFIKKTQKTPKKEINKAKKNLVDHKRRHHK